MKVRNSKNLSVVTMYTIRTYSKAYQTQDFNVVYESNSYDLALEELAYLNEEQPHFFHRIMTEYLDLSKSVHPVLYPILAR